ncbi:MAG TPA: hypothetical protein VGR25_12575 [bacterium]|nr:hypothetical protein [bacterium]
MTACSAEEYRRATALGLLTAFFALTIFAVVHIHGLSDPDAPHSFGELFLLAQAQAGFTAAGLLVIVVFAAARLGWLLPVRNSGAPSFPRWGPSVRGPPVP